MRLYFIDEVAKEKERKRKGKGEMVGKRCVNVDRHKHWLGF